MDTKIFNMFYKSYAKSEARAFDHLYDPIYTTGNYRDIQRENISSLTRTAPVNIYTNFDSMFSELPQRPRTYQVLQRNQLPTTPEINGSHQRRDNHYASGRNRAKFFNIPLSNSATKSVHVQLNQNTDDVTEINRKSTKPSSTATTPAKSTLTKSRPKSRSINCQTVYREQSAQTRPYLPHVQYWPGIETTELYQLDSSIDVDSPFGLSEIKAINRRRKRAECEKILDRCKNSAEKMKHQIAETFEWEEWLRRENDLEDSQFVRFQNVQEMLKQRDKLFEIDSIKTIDYSVNRLNNEHKRQIENMNKKYERSIRKLRKWVYNETKGGSEHSHLIEAIHKVRHGNLNNLIASRGRVSDDDDGGNGAVGSRKYETALKRIENVGSFTANYEQAMHVKSPIEAPKKAVCEIMPGFLKDNNLRIVYEALKAYRLQQTIHNEISNKLKSIDKLRTTAKTYEKTAQKITEHKNQIAEMLKILAHLKELLQNIPHISIDSFVDLLMHKFNVIQTECTVNDLLNAETPQPTIVSSHFASMDIYESLNDNFSSAAYLTDILRRCNELKQEQVDDENTTDDVENQTMVMTNTVVRDIVWPDIMDRLENYLDQRKQIKVDLKRLTSQEEAMVESVRNECVESIIDDLFQHKQQ